MTSPQLEHLLELARRGGVPEAYAQITALTAGPLRDDPAALVLHGRLSAKMRRAPEGIRILDRVPALGDPEQTAWSLVWRAEACSSIGRLREAIEDVGEAVRRARLMGNAGLLIAALVSSSAVAQRVSALPAAVRFYEEARALAAKANRRHDRARMVVVGAPPLVAVGRSAEAVVQLEEAWDYAVSEERFALAQRVGNKLALARIRAGELDRALELLDRVLVLKGGLSGLSRIEWLQSRNEIARLRGEPRGAVAKTLCGVLPTSLDRAFVEAEWALVGPEPLEAGPHLDLMEDALKPGFLAALQATTVLRAVWCAHAGDWPRVEELLGRPVLARVNTEVDVQPWLDRLAELAGSAGRTELHIRALSLARPFYAQYGHPRAEEILEVLRGFSGDHPLGPFAIGRLLGEGGAGRVFEGVHRLSGIPVVLKVLRQDVGHRQKLLVTLFEREVRRTAGLEHPGVLPALDHGVVDAGLAAARDVEVGAPYLVLPRMDGDLSAFRGRLAWSEVRSLLLQVLDGLAAAHARQVVHLDIKPDNLLYRRVDGDLQVWLGDFGLATSYAEMRSRRAGTPNFMAPEQWEGDVTQIGPWTDLYALGCTAVELLSGRPPFEARSLDALELAHRLSPRPTLEGQVAVPTGFDAWLAKMTDADPYQRFARARDAANALRHLDGGGASRLQDLPRSVMDAGLSLVAHRRSPVYGRHEVRARLEGALHRAEREAVLVDLVGQPGEGTTRLARWIGELRHVTGGQFWDLRMGAVGPALAVRDVLVRCVVGPVDDVEEAVRLASELDLPSPERLVALAGGLVPEQEVMDVFWEVARVAAGWRPLVVLLDEYSEPVELPDAPVLVVRTRRGRLAEGLGRLGDEDLAKSLRGLAPVSGATAAAFARLARGNPGHAQQLLLLAIEQRLLTPTSTGYSLDTQWHGALPSSYGATLFERLRQVAGATHLPLLGELARGGRSCPLSAWRRRYLDVGVLPALERAGLIDRLQGQLVWSHGELHRQVRQVVEGVE